MSVTGAMSQIHLPLPYFLIIFFCVTHSALSSCTIDLGARDLAMAGVGGPLIWY